MNRRSAFCSFLSLVTAIGCAPLDEVGEPLTGQAWSAASTGDPFPKCTASAWGLGQCDAVLVSPFAGGSYVSNDAILISPYVFGSQPGGPAPTVLEQGRLSAGIGAWGTTRVTMLGLRSTWRSLCRSGPTSYYNPCGVQFDYVHSSGHRLRIYMEGNPYSSNSYMPNVDFTYYTSISGGFYLTTAETYAPAAGAPTPTGRRMSNSGYPGYWAAFNPYSLLFGTSYPSWVSP